MQKNSKKVLSFIVLSFVFINFLSIFNVNALSISDGINDKNVISVNEISNFKVTNNLNGIEVKHSLADCGSSLL